MGTHEDLHVLRNRLARIHTAMVNFQPLASAPPILDSSVFDRSEHSEANEWLQQENVSGLRSLRESVKRDLDVLEKFLADPKSATMPPLSTNGVYLCSVWGEVVGATAPIVSIFKAIHLAGPSVEARVRGTAKIPGLKIDVVAANGREWIRVNTIKNARILAEFREIDSYFTDSESDEDEEDGEAARPSLRQTEFDNSVLRMGRQLIGAAALNPVPGTDETPRVIMRLTRLEPSAPGVDPRIAQTIEVLREMGVEVQLGERDEPDPSSTPATPLAPKVDALPLRIEPTQQVNLDLSVLIALVSDLTHAPLPTTAEEASQRFVPSKGYREWKKTRINALGRLQPDEEESIINGDLGKHSRQLANQSLQEMGKGMLQEIHDRLSAVGDLSEVRFWTTTEARDRCMRIVNKIGGEGEKRRARTLLQHEGEESLEERSRIYWTNSRFPSGFIPLFPVQIHQSPAVREPSTDLSPFFKALSMTCKDILAQETMPNPRALPKSLIEDEDEEDEDDGSGSSGPPSAIVRSGTSTPARREIQRATVTKANPRLTAHTVQSMQNGADLGWTTLSANKTSVKAMLREMKAARTSGKLEREPVGTDGSEVVKAAIWIVDPRSLAEGMRSDGVFVAPPPPGTVAS